MRLLADDCVALVIDVQERLLPVLSGADLLLARTLRLIEGLRLLGVPFVLSEQYPKGLGPTVVPLRAALPGVEPLAKLSFSCWDDQPLRRALEAAGRSTVLVFGVEAHVCVQQTVIDLLAAGRRAVVVADAVTSRDPADVERALQRLRAEGAVVTGSESLLFELLRVAGTDTFRAVSRLVK